MDSIPAGDSDAFLVVLRFIQFGLSSVQTLLSDVILDVRIIFGVLYALVAKFADKFVLDRRRRLRLGQMKTDL